MKAAIGDTYVRLLQDDHEGPIELLEAAVGERIVYWIRTPQVPGSMSGWYGTFYWASDWLLPKQHQRV